MDCFWKLWRRDLTLLWVEAWVSQFSIYEYVAYINEKQPLITWNSLPVQLPTLHLSSICYHI